MSWNLQVPGCSTTIATWSKQVDLIFYPKEKAGANHVMSCNLWASGLGGARARPGGGACRERGLHSDTLTEVQGRVPEWRGIADAVGFSGGRKTLVG